MDIQTILNLGIVGAGASIFISYLKAKLGTEGYGTKLITLAMALVLGAGFAYFSDKGYMDAIYNVLSISTIIYAFIIKED